MRELERWQGDHPPTEGELRAKLESKGYLVSRYVYPPATHFPDHEHPIDKIDAVLSGRFRMVLNGQEVVLGPGDSLEVPRGTVHSAEVLGEEPVVSLDATRS
jgi:quercetin dioxygenase-like cupin family protein